MTQDLFSKYSYSTYPHSRFIIAISNLRLNRIRLYHFCMYLIREFMNFNKCIKQGDSAFLIKKCLK